MEAHLNQTKKNLKKISGVTWTGGGGLPPPSLNRVKICNLSSEHPRRLKIQHYHIGLYTPVFNFIRHFTNKKTKRPRPRKEEMSVEDEVGDEMVEFELEEISEYFCSCIICKSSTLWDWQQATWLSWQRLGNRHTPGRVSWASDWTCTWSSWKITTDLVWWIGL